MRIPSAIGAGTKDTVAAIIVGAAAAVVTSVLFEVLPAPWDSLANTSALWGLVPFCAAALIGRRSSAVRGVALAVLAMVVFVGGWIVGGWILVGPAATTGREIALFAVVGSAAGLVCGYAGVCVRGSHETTRIAGAAVMSGLVLGEAVYGRVLIGGPQWIAEALLALVVIAVSVTTVRSRIVTLLVAAGLAALSYGFYLAYDAILASG